jgi:transposase
VTGIREPDMLTGMTERDWLITLEVFDAVQSSRGGPGRDDRKFLEAIHYFTVHSITWRALPKEFGNWNSVWKRFWRLSRSGVFEAFFQVLAECIETAHLMQFFDSMTARAHVSAAGAKGGSSIRRSAARVVVLDQNSSQDRSRRPSSRLPPDRWRSQRQHAVRDIARPRPGHSAADRGDRQGI